ncbi:MAG TPA: OmpA family protein [Candidatus Omnitrophota bacterium]|nr:OmpA family protein [Candidatus Omnitrophota bacterium]
MLRKSWFLIGLIVLTVGTAGCSRTKELEKINRQQAMTIASLNEDLARLNSDLAALQRSKDDLLKTKEDLERKLKAELGGGDLTLTMGDRGVVLTVLDRVLFDSGKAEIKDSAKPTLDKVASILGQDAVDNMIYVEGHTDNVPIRHSGWKSNWELSTARATEVIHRLSDGGGIEPKRLVACGYGEFHPVASNDTAATRQKNRRVEIVVSPRKFGDSTVSDVKASDKKGEGAVVIK